MRRLLLSAGFVLLACVPTLANAATPIQPSSWQAQQGDEFIVDVDANVGYLLHLDGSYTTFLVATGMRKTVRYLGNTYYAETPLDQWVAKAKMIQGDKVNFGPSGRFFRLFRDGVTRTSYGIHSHRDIQKWLGQDARYRSLGCIVVSESILDIIDDTVALNGGQLTVITTYGQQKFLDEVATRIQQQEQSWTGTGGGRI